MRLINPKNRTHCKPLKIFALVLRATLLTAILFSFCVSPCLVAGFTDINFKKAGKFITALERDNRERVWIGTEDEGVLVCDPAGDGDHISGVADMPGIIQKKDIAARSWFAELRWPSKEIIRKARATPEQEMLIKPVVLRSLQRILQHSVLPEDLPDRLLPVRKQINNNDAVFIRYNLEDASVQVVVTSARVRILYRNTDITRSTREGMLKLLEDSVRRLLKKSNEVLSIDFGVVENSFRFFERLPH
jgi:hypothetical protein